MAVNTGRVTRTLTPTARQIVFGDNADHDIDAELGPMTEIDLAHLVMLAECELVPRSRVAALLKLIQRLREADFAPLRGRVAPRGLFLMYEDHLIEVLGDQIGGSLHTGRSRNDLKATVLQLRLREQVRGLFEDAVRLQVILLRRARRYADVVMPVYTHFQPAVPVTYGHYLLGVATALDRDIAALRQAADGLRCCPMGACGVGGTDLPIDPARVAHLLGFEHTATNSIDGVASRDVPLRVLFAATSLALTTGRFATDAQLWSTQEFGLLDFPDHLVGTSSIMPQKRNAFLLEHIKAKPAVVAASAQTLVMASKGVPFTNSIEIGTEGVSGIWDGLRATRDAVVLTRLMAADAVPRPDRMADRAAEGWTTATALANRLVRDGVPFRQAHHQVGALVRQCLAEADSTAPANGNGNGQRGVLVGGARTEVPSPAQVVADTVHGGGPGGSSVADQFERLRGRLAEHVAADRAWGELLRSRRRELVETVARGIRRWRD